MAFFLRILKPLVLMAFSPQILKPRVLMMGLFRSDFKTPGSGPEPPGKRKKNHEVLGWPSET